MMCKNHCQQKISEKVRLTFSEARKWVEIIYKFRLFHEVHTKKHTAATKCDDTFQTPYCTSTKNIEILYLTKLNNLQ